MDTISVFSCSIKKNKNEKLINSNKKIKEWLKNKIKNTKFHIKKLVLKILRIGKLKNIFSNFKKEAFSIIGLNKI